MSKRNKEKYNKYQRHYQRLRLIKRYELLIEECDKYLALFNITVEQDDFIYDISKQIKLKIKYKERLDEVHRRIKAEEK